MYPSLPHRSILLEWEGPEYEYGFLWNYKSCSVDYPAEEVAPSATTRGKAKEVHASSQSLEEEEEIYTPPPPPPTSWSKRQACRNLMAILDAESLRRAQIMYQLVKDGQEAERRAKLEGTVIEEPKVGDKKRRRKPRRRIPGRGSYCRDSGLSSIPEESAGSLLADGEGDPGKRPRV